MVSGSELLESCDDHPRLKLAIEKQISRELKPGDTIRVIEAGVIHDWQIDQNRPVA
jgi:quercetin dioxygenase-like cupin family protein